MSSSPQESTLQVAPSGDEATQAACDLIHQELREGRLELPLMPGVASQVLTSSLDERNDAEDLASLIQQDQSLASHILRVVNTPAYRGATEIVALQQAIARLGLERIREIALTASLKGALFQPGPYDELMQQVWRDALSTALWAKEVARSLRKNVETAYLCGLLNNVGDPVVLHRLATAPDAISVGQAEQVMQRCGSAAGVTLTQMWQLPGLVTKCIAHGSNFLASPDEHDAIAIIVAGKEFAQSMKGEEIEAESVLKQDAVQFLNLYPEDIESLIELQPQVQETLDAMSN